MVGLARRLFALSNPQLMSVQVNPETEKYSDAACLDYQYHFAGLGDEVLPVHPDAGKMPQQYHAQAHYRQAA